MNKYANWRFEKDADEIIWLALDKKDANVNTINVEVLDELNNLIKEFSELNAKGLIIYSAKDKGFIAGADVTCFSTLQSENEIADFLKKGQIVFARLEALKIPKAAMIDGFCLGGGLELALACDYRIATDAKDSLIGLPEVRLGIHPGWGGMIRLPQLIGGYNAIAKVILPGIPLSAAFAKKLGILDDVVAKRQLRRAAIYLIKNKPPKHKPSFLQGHTNNAIVRSILSPLLRYFLAKKISKTHYPAPYAIIDFWEKQYGTSERSYQQEADSVEKLVFKNNTAKNLIRDFLLHERLKSYSKGKLKVSQVHVIGAGLMGGDIAAWCALKGNIVTLQDKSYTQIGKAYARAQQLFKKKLKKPRLIQAAMDRIIPDPNGLGVAKAQVIIEAVFEDLSVKQDIFKHLETEAAKDAILATNTSSIPLEDIAQVMQQPQRLVGIHFFNPVAKMELVEIVSSKYTEADIANNASVFVGRIGKLPLSVRSHPGFLINRILMPYLMEAVLLLEEGHEAVAIDKAAKNFGMMMGPIELADTVGLDVCKAVAENLTSHFGGKVPEILIKMVQENKLGRKVGKGFYNYKNGKPIKHKIHQKPDPAVTNRLIYAMINESFRCLSQNVVADGDLLDAGMIFGTGFAPFRGGPIHYAKTLGKEKVNENFSSLAGVYGPRFKAELIDIF